MCVANPRLVSADSSPLVAPHALWGHNTLELTDDPVRSNAGQAVRRQKRLYEQQAVKHIFTFGDWTMRYCPPAVTCKLRLPWLSPYLFVSLCGLVVGVQLQPDSAMLFVHCQDLEKILQPRSLVSSMPAPGWPELGPSAVTVSVLCSAALPPV